MSPVVVRPGKSPLTERTAGIQAGRRNRSSCPEPVIQEGTLNEDRVGFGWPPFLVADVAGYSPLMGTDEEGTFATLKTLLRELIEPKNQGASWPICLHGLSRA